MVQLSEFYRLPDVIDLCKECGDWSNKQLDEVRKSNAPEMRRRIAARLDKPARERKWYDFLFLTSR